MSPGQEPGPGSSSASPRREHVRRVKRLFDRYGLALEGLLVVSLLVVFVIGLAAFVVGAYGAHGNGPDSTLAVIFFGSWVVVLLGLVALGLLVTLNGVLPLVCVREGELAVDATRFQSVPRWYPAGQAIKLCCGAAVVFLAVLGLLSWGILAVDSDLLSVPGGLVAVGKTGAFVAVFAVPVTASALGLVVFAHALGRALGFVSG